MVCVSLSPWGQPARQARHGTGQAWGRYDQRSRTLFFGLVNWPSTLVGKMPRLLNRPFQPKIARIKGGPIAPQPLSAQRNLRPGRVLAQGYAPPASLPV